MTEAEFTREVLALARKHSVLAHWCQDPRRCEGRAGLTDLILVTERSVMFAELKLKGADTSADQDMWLWSLSRVSDENRGVFMVVYTPDDLASGLIEDDLRNL